MNNKSIGRGRAICLELDNDVDDFVAYKYLEAINEVDYVVLSPEPSTPEGMARKILFTVSLNFIV